MMAVIGVPRCVRVRYTRAYSRARTVCREAVLQLRCIAQRISVIREPTAVMYTNIHGILKVVTLVEIIITATAK